jgi:CubicO group peptidase (beta-lactamase class C family)
MAASATIASARRVMVSPNDGRVHVVGSPVELPGDVRPFLLPDLMLPVISHLASRARSRRALSLAVLVGVAGTVVAPRAGAQSQAARVDSIFGFASDSTPGCAVAAARDGTVLYTAGYGLADLENRVRITPQTTFYLASVSKQFTAAAINLLVLDGRLSLSDDVRKYVPEVPDFGRTITIGHLLHHTSGLRDYLTLFSLAGLNDFPITNGDFLAMVGRQQALNFPPGQQYSYSNTGYVLLGLVVERVTGKSLRAFAQERIFGPLGTSSTQFRDRHTTLIPRRASAYASGPRGYTLSVPYFDVVGDGGLFSSVEDLTRWEANFWAPRVGGEAWLQATRTRGRLADGTPIAYGAGLAFNTYRGDSIVEHGGGLGGYNTQILRFPHRHFSVVVLCNSFAVPASTLARRVADVYLGDILAPMPGAVATQPARPPAVAARVSGRPGTASGSDDLVRYTGIFFSDESMLVRRIAVDSGRLRYVRGPGNSSELLPSGARRFDMAGTSLSVVFSADADTVRLEGGDPPVVLRRREPAAMADLGRYAGAYLSPELRTTWTFAVSGQTLLLRAERGDSARLTPAFADAFEGPGILVQFRRDAAGQVVAADVSAGDQARRIHFTRP